MKLNYLGVWSLLLVMVFGVGCERRPPELLFPNSDFEMGNLTGWRILGGDAFDAQPIRGDNIQARHRGISGHAGKYWIGTYERSNPQGPADGRIQTDLPQGVLESQEFTLKNKRVQFLIGGGQASELTGVGLKVNGAMVLFEPGRGVYVNQEEMHRVVWDVSDWAGQRAVIVIRDQAGDAWGHINADDFRYR